MFLIAETRGRFIIETLYTPIGNHFCAGLIKALFCFYLSMLLSLCLVLQGKNRHILYITDYDLITNFRELKANYWQ